MEVNRDKLRDIGFDWGLGSATSAETSTITTQAIRQNASGRDAQAIGGHALGSQFAPSVFGPKETVSATGFSGAHPYTAGGEFIFQKLTGTKFEAIIHALEEDVHTNTLPAPRVLTLDNQEASILVGYHTPILKSTVTAGTTGSGEGATVTQDLDYYQEIGIRLNVVPQVNEEGYINMIIHPSVTSSTTSVTATSVASGVTTATSYPIIDVRETQTQILTKDGETVVIGGLLKDIKSKETIGTPFLKNIPGLGALFRRDTYDTVKVDLLIFITARLLKDDDFTPEEIAKLEKRLGQETAINVDAISGSVKKKKKK
jgi:general secretion pathway protein D